MPETILFSPGGASEVTLAALLAELQTKLDEGGTVSLSPATLAALEQVTVTLANTTVALDVATLAALEQTTATIANLPADYPDATVAALLATIRDRTVIPTMGRVPVTIEGGSVNVSASFASFISTVNSTDAPLAAGETFTGAWEDVRDYAAISVFVLVNAASVTDGAVVQFTDDPLHGVLSQTATTIPANLPVTYSFRPEARYVRFVYTNGATPATTVRSEVSYQFNAPAVAQTPLAYQTTDLVNATPVKSHLVARHSSGAWLPLSTAGDGSLNVVVANPVTSVAVSNLPATQPVSGTVALDATSLAALENTTVTVATTPALTDTQLRATPVMVRDPIAYYATAAGGRVAFNITTGLISIGATGEQLLGALVNPAGSGFDIYLDVGEFGSSQNATFRRYRNSTITPTGTAVQANNMGGGTATTPAVMYVGGATPTFTRTGGTVSKTAHIAAYDQYLTEIKGKSVLRPGQSLSWTITSAGGGITNFTASIFFEFWSLPAAA